MVEISEKVFNKDVEKTSEFNNRVNELVSNNKIIGKESTLTDVLVLFKEFNINDNNLGKRVKTYVINRVLGGEQK